MSRSLRIPLLAALLTLGGHQAWASTAYGDLNNFDTVNDTGQECHGFEIEIEGARSTDVTYTYDWNHYGAPKIREDLSNPASPKVFVRYESAKNPDGTWAAYTAVPLAPLTPTDGHSCTNPSVNDGCEHFGVGYYGAPTAIRYHWLVDDGAGTLIHGPAVNVATPTWVYSAPVAQDPALPPDPVANPIVQPAQVVAAIPAPDLQIPPGKQFGEPTWVKVIKTTTHNPNDVALGDLISDDLDGDGNAEWQNREPAEVESEWSLLQTNSGANPAVGEVQGLPDDMGDGDQTVTRRYEFYAYTGDATTVDGETGEAMCSAVDTDGSHGIGTAVKVTDANGDSYFVDCTAQVVVGDYLGAQMAGFDAAAPLGLIDNLQSGDPGVAYTPRSVVIGGNTPYSIVVSGNLPAGLALGDYVDPETGAVASGVLWGTPTAAGAYDFSVEATDADGAIVSRTYSLAIGAAAPVSQFRLSADAAGTGTGTVTGGGLDCGTNCTVTLDAGTSVTLSAIPAAGSVFKGWQGACTGTGECLIDVVADATVTAVFDQQYVLGVTKSGTGSGAVGGNGIDCGAVCSVSLDAGTAVTLTATPAQGSVFGGWSGACTGTGTCSVTMDAAKSVTANFVPATQKLALSVTKTGSGTVSSSPKGISCGRTCSASFTVGTTVKLTATPAKGKSFLGWSGACSGTALTCSLIIRSNQSVGAAFN